jgi:predicted HD phosphohydrolase
MVPSTRAEVALLLLDQLRGLDSGLGIDDYAHSLQTATRAERAGAEPELVVAALLHDSGKAITMGNHGVIAAEVLAGPVHPNVVWTVRVHQDFTSAELDNGHGRRARYRHALRPGYAMAKRFVDEWDLPSRDPSYDTLPVEHFAPLVHDVLGGELLHDRWSRMLRATLSRLPDPVAEGIDRASEAPRRWVKGRLGG